MGNPQSLSSPPPLSTAPIIDTSRDITYISEHIYPLLNDRTANRQMIKGEYGMVPSHLHAKARDDLEQGMWHQQIEFFREIVERYKVHEMLGERNELNDSLHQFNFARDSGTSVNFLQFSVFNFNNENKDSSEGKKNQPKKWVFRQAQPGLPIIYKRQSLLSAYLINSDISTFEYEGLLKEANKEVAEMMIEEEKMVSPAIKMRKLLNKRKSWEPNEQLLEDDEEVSMHDRAETPMFGATFKYDLNNDSHFSPPSSPARSEAQQTTKREAVTQVSRRKSSNESTHGKLFTIFAPEYLAPFYPTLLSAHPGQEVTPTLT